jgi:hypothetical protein
VVLFNGFRSEQDGAAWRAVLEHVDHEELWVTPAVLDLAAYRYASECISAARYCFLNSYSVVRTDGWLSIMSALGSAPDVGAVGATGSWGSQASHFRYDLGLGGPYAGLMPRREATREVFAELTRDKMPVRRGAGSLRAVIDAAYGLAVYAAAFASFPSPHLRTNCLLVRRDPWLRACRAPRDKLDAYRVESGRRGISARLTSMGLRLLVAGRDGRGYAPPEWAASRTFWQHNQENLLVGDNQTDTYQHGDRQLRSALSSYAWGADADPGDTQVGNSP